MRLSGLLKAAQAAALVVGICFTLGATDSTARVDKLGHRLMCTCGCAQLLGECDHVGCPNRGEELDDLTASVKNGADDKEIFASFSNKYGATVLAAPTTHGFDLVAWIAPGAVFLAAVLGVLLVVKSWSAHKTTLSDVDGQAAATPEMSALKEKIRRETGADGGF
jgi:cytochrome c-type biogenesis protein CcmH